MASPSSTTVRTTSQTPLTVLNAAEAGHTAWNLLQNGHRSKPADRNKNKRRGYASEDPGDGLANLSFQRQTGRLARGLQSARLAPSPVPASMPWPNPWPAMSLCTGP